MNAVTIEEVWAEILTPVAGAAITTLPGTSPAVLDPQAHLLVVDCEEAEHMAGPYWRALVRLTLDTPAVKVSPLPAHTAAFSALSDWFDDPANAEAAFAGRTDLHLNGIFVQRGGNRREGNRWQAQIEFIAGHSKP